MIRTTQKRALVGERSGKRVQFNMETNGVQEKKGKAHG